MEHWLVSTENGLACGKTHTSGVRNEVLGKTGEHRPIFFFLFSGFIRLEMSQKQISKEVIYCLCCF